MVSDLMADETCLALARVLGARNEGFIQMTLVSADPMHDASHFEQLAEVSGRPVLFNVVQPRDSHPYVHRGHNPVAGECRQRGLPVYGQAVTTDAGLTFTFVDWNLFDDARRGAKRPPARTEERKAKLGDPARRERSARPRAAHHHR